MKPRPIVLPGSGSSPLLLSPAMIASNPVFTSGLLIKTETAALLPDGGGA